MIFAKYFDLTVFEDKFRVFCDFLATRGLNSISYRTLVCWHEAACVTRVVATAAGLLITGITH
jgi:hypothetical protein